ncbi:transposase [Burkholderia cepacia GG4]|uniref:Transposase n=1 Tax=Burkholderia cepacia GG4 TaxID=1009846 RepID=A0A9W3PCG4_BURCE|nr:transposase [Burkholderia cepacia GG4]
MYRLNMLTGNRLRERRVYAPATEAAVRVGVLNRMADLGRPQFVRIA